jgi:rhamnogalacturonan hydrolase
MRKLETYKTHNDKQRRGKFSRVSNASSMALFLVLSVLYFVFAAQVLTQLIAPVGPTTPLILKQIECNILSYGAISDNQTDVSSAIYTAFNECVKTHPGSRLVIPPGNYLLNHSVVLSNGTNWALQVDGLITAAYGGNWSVDRSLILEGYAGAEVLNETINGEGDDEFLEDVLVIVNGELNDLGNTNGTNKFSRGF